MRAALFSGVLALIVLVVWVLGLDPDDGGSLVQGRWTPWPDTFVIVANGKRRLAPDKVGHFTGSAIAACVGALVGIAVLLAALLTVAVAGVGWELQQWYPFRPSLRTPTRFGRFSWKDLVADACGALVGAGAAALVLALVHWGQR
jgi:hypothetical protein